MFKKLLFAVLAVLCYAGTSTAAVVAVAPTNVSPAVAEAFLGDDGELTTADFLSLTPRKIREATGKKLTLKEAIGLKLAQKKIKREMRKAERRGEEPEISKGLFIICAIFVPIVAVIFMGLADDWQGNNWWTALILYALCYLPGLIYTLTKVKNYYPNGK